MADNQEEVVYAFQGDVSSLRDATNEALGLLNKYQDQISRISTDGGFGKNVKAAKSFQAQINSITKQLSSMQSQMQQVSNVKLLPSSKTAQELSSSFSSIGQVLSTLANSSGLSTKQVQALTSQLKLAKQGIQDNSAAVDTLVQKEAAWQQTLDTVRAKTTQVRDTLDGFKSRIAGVFDPMMSKMNAISSPFQTLTAKLQSFKDRASDTFGRVAQLADTVVSALRRVSSAEGSADGAAARAATSHSKLSSILSSIQNAFKKETKSIEDEKDSLDQKNQTLKQSTQHHSSLLSVLASLGSRFSRETSSVKSFSSNINILSSAAKSLKSALQGLIGVNIGAWLAEATKQSINYTENLNLFEVAMGDCVDQGMEFVNTMSELYGMDPSNLLRYAGNFYQLADAIDMPSQASANLSLGLTKATNDIASLFNVDVETVFNNLSSGMQGMSRAVRKYGMDIRATTLEQTALSLGITESTDSMSEANLQGLRFITMMRQAMNASGDFASTIETPANQLRIFKEQITQLGRAIGNLFITPLATAIQYINGFVMALRMAIQFIGLLLGLVSSFSSGASSATDSANDLASSVGGIGSAASDAAKELKKTIAPFDELNLLNAPDTDSGSSGGGGTLSDIGNLDPAIEQAIADMQWKLEDVKMKAIEVRDALLEFFGFEVSDGQILSWDASQFEENLINKFPQWTQTIQAAFDHWSEIVDGFKAVFDSLGAVVEKVKQKVSDFFSLFINDDSVSSFIEELGPNLQSLAAWIDKNSDSIANLVIVLGTLKVFSNLLPTIMSVITWVERLAGFLPTISSLLAGITAPMAAISAVIAVIAIALVDLYVTNEEFRDKVNTAWNDLVQVISLAWNSCIKPIFTSIISTVKEIYENTIKPVVEEITTLLLTLWSDVIQPIVVWLINTLAPAIKNVVNDILAVVEWLFDSVGGVIRGIIQVLQGIVDFVVGVFTGDWSRAWEGIVDVFAGIFNAVGSVVVAVINAVITVINLFVSAVYNTVISVVNAVLEIVNSIGSALGFTMSLGIDAETPQIPYLSAPTVGLANGGVVTGPTNALIGEGRYDEAVVPLGNSPQMRQFADSVADRVNSGEQIALLKEQNELLRQILEKSGTYIDGRKLTDVVSKYQRRDARAKGV